MSSREWAIASSESIGIELVCSLNATGAPISSGGLFVQGAQKVQRVLLGSLDRIVAACDPGWRLINGLTINVEKDEDGEYIVSDDVFFVYGSGLTEFQAVQDYVVSLTEYYRLVEASRDDPFDRAEFRRLQVYLTDAA